MRATNSLAPIAVDVACGHIYGDWRQRIVTGLVAHVAETLELSIGHEFGRRVSVLFLQSSFPFKL